jgi:hypothetical protein
VSPGAKLAINITWTWPAVIALLVFAMLPIWGPLMPPLEGALWPVTSKVAFINQAATPEGGMLARMSYVKNRDCEIIGVSMDRAGLPVDFEPAAGSLDNLITRGTGPQISRQWLIGDDSIQGLRLRFIYRCHTLWTTVVIVYP